MGGGGPTSTTVTQPSAPMQVPAQIPGELSPLVSQSAALAKSLQANAANPFMAQAFGPNPQQIPGLTPTQQALMGLSTSIPFQGPLTPEQRMAFQGAQQFMSGQSAPQLMATGIENQFLGIQPQASQPPMPGGKGGGQPTAGQRPRGLGEVTKGWMDLGLGGGLSSEEGPASLGMGPGMVNAQQGPAPVGVFGGPMGKPGAPAGSPAMAPIGQSPLTLQGMQAWRDLVAPTVMQQQALQGTAQGGAALEALAQSGEAAAVPFIQQEIQNRMNLIPELQGQAGLQASMVPQLTGLGAAGFGQQQQALGSALGAAQMPYDVAQAQAQADYADFLRRQGLAEQLSLGPIMSLGPQMISPAQTVFPQTQTTRQGGGGFMGK